MKVLLISNYAENSGGISVQVKLLYEKLCSEGVEFNIINTKGNAIYRLLLFGILIIKGWKYDIFHIHACSYRGFLPAIIGIPIGRLLRKKTILTYHGGDAETFFKKNTTLIKYMLNKTDNNIVLSQFLAGVFDKFGLKYEIIPNIIELPTSNNVIKARVKPDYVCVRSFTNTYNIECLIKAFNIVKESITEATLTLIGDGPKKEELKDYVSKNSINGVTFVGQIKNSAIYEYLAKASIMVSPSRFDNMPVSILEGFNAGLIVIASNVGGVPYMINDNKNGFLFENDNIEDLVCKMKYVLQIDPKPIISAAHESLKTYSWENCKEKLFLLYSK